MLKLTFVTAALFVLPAPVLAQAAPVTPAPQASATPDKSKSDLDKVVCRSQDTIGSRLERHQICMTKQQWMTNEQEAKLKVHDLQMQGFVAH
ncbi:MAG: hypothetical protein HOP95_07270 [Sphingomonas sp.]|nr:hypothetical protein [Sphingomonas sp.]